MNTSPRPKNLDNRPVAIEDRWTSWHDNGLPIDVARCLTLAGTHTHEAAEDLERLADDLQSFLDRYERPHVAVDRWLAAADSWEDRLDRRMAVATFEQLSSLRFTPLPWPGWVAPSGTPRKRVMRDLEVGLLRMVVRSYDLRRIVHMALLEAGASSGELVQVTPKICDGTQVHLPGTRQWAARTITVGTWAQSALSDLVARVPAGQSLLYSGNAQDPAVIESSLQMNFSKPFAQAGLMADKTLAQMSIRHTGLRHIYNQHGVEAAAAACGTTDWGKVQKLIGMR